MLFLFALIFIFPLINTFIRTKKEFKGKYEFTIKEVEVTPTKQLKFVDMEGKEISLWNYTIMQDQGVKQGDSIYKDKCSYYLYVFKKDNLGRYKVFKKVRPSGLFESFFYKN